MASEPGAETSKDVLFCSLGMFIIDTIEQDDGKMLENVIGGAGTYAAVGARMFSKPYETSFLVDYGIDSLPELENEIASFGFRLITRRDDKRQCTRGMNKYEGDHRTFHYLTPKIRIVPEDLPPQLLRSRSFHLICTPERCINIVTSLQKLRRSLDCQESLLTIWEPVPDSCTPDNRELFNEAMRLVSVLTPNDSEAAGILGRREQSVYTESEIENMARTFIDYGCCAVVIRCSSRGSYIQAPGFKSWFGPVIRETSMVVDATGAGNTFCGALAISLAKEKSWQEAMSCASVAASLAIEQAGLPQLRSSADGDLWNHKSIESLLLRYQSTN